MRIVLKRKELENNSTNLRNRENVNVKGFQYKKGIYSI